jgi:hypothetical protein
VVDIDAMCGVECRGDNGELEAAISFHEQYALAPAFEYLND